MGGPILIIIVKCVRVEGGRMLDRRHCLPRVRIGLYSEDTSSPLNLTTWAMWLKRRPCTLLKMGGTSFRMWARPCFATSGRRAPMTSSEVGMLGRVVVRWRVRVD